ncbi:MAG: transporter [Woeseiaceae bacterium]
MSTILFRARWAPADLGTNRWALKPAVGMIVPLHPTWLFEIEVGAWLFGDNDDFLGETREQDPIVSTEIHLIKRIRPGFWASLDANYYTGGETRSGDEFSDDLQRNSRAGITLVFPIKGRHAVRGGFSTGINTRSGGDFEMYSLSWAFAW